MFVLIARGGDATADTTKEAIEGADHWSFQPPVRHPAPAVKNVEWVRSPIDAFILSRLESENIAPAPEADRATLVRRLTLDLLGLTPTPTEVDEFVRDVRPDAYERLVDRLLDSPHFGERWGRHWLDLARYADSDGYEKDSFRPDAWRFRTWVIEALNADMPFDEFTIEQLAGDLLPDATRDQLVATGFHRQTLINTEGGVDQEEFRVNANMDRVATTGAVWLGLTLFCAECHDHKYDAIKTKEFYELFAFYNNADDQTYNFPATGPQAPEFEKNLQSFQNEVNKLNAEIERAKRENADPTGRLKQLVDTLMRKERDVPRSPAGAANIIRERTEPRASRILVRGDYLQPGAIVSPATLAVLPPLKSASTRPTRLDLARWLVDPANPLTARVTANRIWSRLFGRGIVATVDDFGVMGEPPTHPEMLDWLATEYVRLGWSTKALIRTIVNSASYQQSSRTRPELAEQDPENTFVARQTRFRVEAEIVRDLYLSCGGILDETLGGPSIRPVIPDSVTDVSYASGVTWKVSSAAERYRRGLYIQFQRTVPYPSLMTFDCPDGVVAAAKRNRSNTPLQSLTLMNDPVFFECTQAMGRRVVAEGTADEDGRMQFAAGLAIGRSLQPQEKARLQYLLAGQKERFANDKSAAAQYAGIGGDAVEAAAWISVCSVLMNLDEFITRE